MGIRISLRMLVEGTHQEVNGLSHPKKRGCIPIFVWNLHPQRHFITFTRELDWGFREGMKE